MPNREPDVGEERAAEYISHILVSINGYVLMSLSIIMYTLELLWSQKKSNRAPDVGERAGEPDVGEGAGEVPKQGLLPTADQHLPWVGRIIFKNDTI